VLRARKQTINTIDSSAAAFDQDRFTLTYPEKSASGVFLNGNIRDKAGQLVQILHEHSLI
jgi:hypothetical protein